MRLRTPLACLNRFLRSESGAVAPMIGLMMIMLIGCMGIAIDTGRSMVVKARLVDALDAAGLAVGARIATSDFNADATKFVTANFKANYAGATVTSVTATPNTDKTVITLAATATMPTSFMKLFGTSAVTVKATSEVTRQSVGLELVMVLDNTGSMEQSGSMPGLKTAANSLVSILFGSDTTAENLFIGLVPFSQAVNIGTSRAGWVLPTTLLPTTNAYYPSYWTGCVEARRNGLDRTDDPPLTTNTNSLFRAYYSPDDDDYNNWIRKYSNGTSYTQIYYYNYLYQQGPGAFCPSEMTLMTNVKSKITTGINAMAAQGSTMINLGAVWGWRMISPRWRGYWGGDMAANSLPLNYGTKNMQKAVIIMTDGENSFSPNNYTAYGALADGRLGYTSQGSAETELDTRLTTVCTSMKTAGVIVYTVAFNNPDSSTKSMLQGCATSSSYYFDAGNTSALNAAFQTIGSSLSNLRVSK